MADYKEMLNGTFHSIVDKLRDTAENTGVKDIYAQGTERAKAYGRITKLTLALNSDNAELGRVYAEIGRLYYEQARLNPEGYFAPLFAQADQLTASIHQKQDEIAALKGDLDSARQNRDIEVEISDFEDIVNATEADGVTGPESKPESK